MSSYFGGTNLMYLAKGREVVSEHPTRVYPRFANASVHVARTYAQLLRLARELYLPQ